MTLIDAAAPWHTAAMPKRSSKRSKKLDMNQIAASIVADITEMAVGGPGESQAKNPAAVALGRLGGLKGGTARAAKLTAKRRKQIAKKAAIARWRP